MQKTWRIAEYPHPGAYGFDGVEAGRGIHDSVVGPGWQQQAYVHPAQDRQAQGGKHRFVGNEIRAGDPHTLGRRVDGLDKKQRAGFIRVCRAAGEQLAEHTVVGVGVRQDQGRQFSCGPEPVFSERLLQAGHHRAGDLHMGIAPRSQRRFFAQVFVTDVVPTNKAGDAIHHYDLAVVAEVDLEAIEPAATGGERLDLHPGVA